MKREYKSPIKEKNLRRPGQKLEEDFDDLLNNKATLLFIIVALLFAMTFMEWYRWFLNEPPLPILYTAIFVIGFIICFYKFMQYKKIAGAIKLGLMGERFIAELLDTFKEKGCKVFHDFPIEYGNIDHIVINQFGIFTIETKTISKKVDENDSIIYDGNIVKFKSGRYLENPIEQAKTEARCLKKFLNKNIPEFKTRIQPVVVYPRWFVTGTDRSNKQGHNTWVVNQDFLDGLINSGQIILGKKEIIRISSAIEKEMKSR